MPGKLSLLGYRFPLAADDMVVPGLGGFAVKLGVAGAWSVLLALHESLTGNGGENGLLTTGCTSSAAPAAVAFFSLNIVVSVGAAAGYARLAMLASQGTLPEWHERHARTVAFVPKIATAYVLQSALLVMGVLIVALDEACRTQRGTQWALVLSGVVLSVLDLGAFVGFVAFVVVAARRGARVGRRGGGSRIDVVRSRLQLLTSAASCLTLGLLGSTKTPLGTGDLAFADLAVVVHTFLQDMMREIVPSDVIAALMLLRAEQRRLERDHTDSLAMQAMDRRILTHTGEPRAAVEAAASPSASSTVSAFSSRTARFLWGGSSSRYSLKSQMFASGSPASPGGGTAWTSSLANAAGGGSREDARAAIAALENFDSFAPYMIAIYGWKVRVYLNPLTGALRTARARLCARGPEGFERRVFLEGTGLARHHLVYSSFTAYLGESVPYTISVDHDRRAVVVACRGTLSIPDIVTDLMCEPESLSLPGRQFGFDGAGHYAHGGMLGVAMRIRVDIEQQQILHRLVAETDVDSEGARQGGATSIVEDPAAGQGMYESEAFVNERELRELGSRGYELLVVGHSLGAGIASILALLLREKFPRVRALAYSPPGCIFSREMADRSASWCTSLVPGKDAVCRLSWHSCKVLRGQLLDVLRRCKTNKVGALRAYGASPRVVTRNLLYDPRDVPVEPGRVELARLIQTLAAGEDDDSNADDGPAAKGFAALTQTQQQQRSILDRVRMYPPGRVLFLAKQHTRVQPSRFPCIPAAKSRLYSPVWIRDRADILDVRVSLRMLLDHFPDFAVAHVKECLVELRRELAGERGGVGRVEGASSP